MDPFVATVLGVSAVLIVAIVAIAGVVGTVKSARLRAERGLRKDWLGNEVPVAGADSRDQAALRDEFEQLRDRVKVLEKIATDKGVLLADEIEALREREPKLEDRSKA